MSTGDLYRRWIDQMWQAPDSELEGLAAELFTEDFTIRQAGAQYETGPGAAVDLIRQARAPFSDIEVGLEIGPIADGDLVAARWFFAGAYTGGLGVPAEEGTRIRFGGIDIMRADGGKLAEYWVSSDGMDLMSQLGAG